MKKSLNTSEKATKPLSGEEIARAELAVERIKTAHQQEEGRRTRAIAFGVTGAVAAVCFGWGALYGMNKADHAIRGVFSDEGQNPGGPQLSDGAPLNPVPVVTVQPKTQTETGAKVSAYKAQRQVKKAMGIAGVSELPVDRTGNFFPKGNAQALGVYLEKARTDYRGNHSSVPQALGDAIVNCSAFVTMRVAQELPERTMNSMIDNLGSDKLDVAAINCEVGALQAMDEHTRFPLMKTDT